MVCFASASLRVTAVPSGSGRMRYALISCF